MLKFAFGILLLTLSFSFSFASKKEKENDFEKNFTIAKQYLSQRKISKALPYLLFLQDKYQNNSNLKYLVGLCYAENEIVNPTTISLLTEASEKVSLNYNPNSLEEDRVPIYVYYYLSLAYSQNRQCEEAEKARQKFLEVYPYKDKYYIDESKKWLNYCYDLNKDPAIVALPSFPEFKPYYSQKIETEESENMLKSSIVDSLVQENKDTFIQKNDRKIVTKKIEYSTRQPLYGVQLGAFKETIPVSRFRSLKNIDAFMDNEGLIRYVIGHFSIHSQAESLLKVIHSKGYEDAFVVNVNVEKKFADEVVSIDDVNIKASFRKKVEYRIQVGAFQDELNETMAKMYLKLEGIQEFSDDQMTYLTVGSYSTYEEAKAYLEGVSDAGIDDAFVIAISENKKIPLQQAINLTR